MIPTRPSRAAIACSWSSEVFRGVSRIARQHVWLTISAAPPPARSSTSANVCSDAREVNGASEREQPIDELDPERAQAARARLAGAVGECVPPRPREADHPDAERPERVDQLGAGSERLGPLQREHQPDPLAALRLVEPGDGAHLEHAAGALAHRVVERAGEPKR
jgi:hypothetical protein